MSSFFIQIVNAMGYAECFSQHRFMIGLRVTNIINHIHNSLLRYNNHSLGEFPEPNHSLKEGGGKLNPIN